MNKSLEQLFDELEQIIKENSQTLNGQVFILLDTKLELKIAEIHKDLRLDEIY